MKISKKGATSPSSNEDKYKSTCKACKDYLQVIQVIKLQFYVIQRDLKLAHGGKINSAECG